MSVNIFKNGILSKIAGAVGDAVPLINNFLTNQEGKGAADANTVYVLNNKIEEVNSSLGDISGFTNTTYDSIGDFIQYCVDNGYLPNINTIALIPTMTSNTTPSGVVSASSTHPNYLAWRAFRNTYDDYGWSPNANSGAPWIKYDFGYKTIIKRLEMRLYSSSSAGAGVDFNFTLSGSNDGSSWTKIYNSINTSSASNGSATGYNFKNDNAYRYYKIDFDKSLYVSGSYQVRLTYCQLFGYKS